MLLDKWYLDAVFPDGTVWFGYRAWLQLWGLRLSWAAGCEVLPNGHRQEASGWTALVEPCQENGQWRWRGPDGFEARWEPAGQGVESELGSEERFKVLWRCVAPRAAVIPLHRPSGRRCGAEDGVSDGLGYIEHLRIKSMEWRIPFRELWWGRAHAGLGSLVWIRWGGGRDLSRVFSDGIQADAQIDTKPEGGVCIQTPAGRWETGEGRPLCDRDVRRSFPRWLVWLTGSLAPSRELKMSGPVRFHTPSAVHTGSGIWEEVNWL